MGDESIWKKEVSFNREPEEGETGAEPSPAERAPETETKESLWTRELNVEPAAEHDPPPAEEAPKETLWKRELNVDLPAEPEVSEAEKTPKETLWTREISLAPSTEEPVVEEPVAEVAPVEETEPQPEPEPELPVESLPEPVALEQEPWDAAPVLPPVPENEAPIVVHPPVPAADLPEPTVEEPKVPFWKKDISLGGKKREKPAKAEKVVSEEPKVPFWKKDVSLGGKKREKPAKAEKVVSEEPKVPFWKKDVSLGGKKREKPAKAEKVVSEEPKVPFWKKDVSLGGKKREKQPKEEKVVSEEPKVPFWKKELSPGGKNKRGKAPKAEAPAPVAPAEEAPTVETPAEPKVPFWKKDLSFGAKKGAKPAKAAREPKAAKAAKAPKARRPRLNLELGSKNAKNFVGLKVGASQLAAARVSNNGTAELQQVARGPLETGIVVGGELRDPDALSEALKHFFSAHGLPKRGVRLGIANNRIGVRTFDITGVNDPKQLANAVRFRAQEALPIPIDEAVLDYQVLSEGVTEEGEPVSRILLVVAYRELIDRYVDACKKAGIALVGIDLEAFALLRALHAPQAGVEGDPTAALVAVAIGHDRATFAVSDGRVCEFTRVLDWGGSALNVAIARVLDAAPSEVEGWKRALALTDEMVPEGLTSEQARHARDAMRRSIQAFARELVSSLQYYQNQPGSLGIGEIVVTGGTAHLPGLAGELERMIGVRVRVGDPLARMKISKKVGEPEQVGSLAVAIGLGIED
jgi:type IV pilus assembly protein PilM